MSQSRLSDYIAARRAEVDRIATPRRVELDAFASDLAPRTHDALSLLFVCTHNSRRSHFTQIWAHVAASLAGLDIVRTYSGGTEVTACNPRTIAALERAGFDIDSDGPEANPRYTIRAGGDVPPALSFSKLIGDAANPQSDFVAVMTCASADAACPIVRGAAQRMPLRYDDPKAFDGTDRETAAYDERCAQIAREMLYLFDRVAKRRD